MPFRDGAFNKVFCVRTLLHVSDYLKATSEIIRVTKEGGVILIEVFNTFHISCILQKLSHIISGILHKDVPPYFIRSHGTILKPFKELHFEVYGFHVLMPTWLPKVGYRFSVANREPFFSKLGRGPLRIFSVSLVVKALKPRREASI
jgi:ubiquinone/menaquinone biosynthesis C-methylase UbiE